MLRILLIHGYVENPAIFDTLAPLLPTDTNQVRLDLATECADWNPSSPVNAFTISQFLSKKYQIGRADVVIGHSMGGWIGANIKQLTGCRLIQLASWTDQAKIISPLRNLTVLRFMARTGLSQHRAVLNYLQKPYPFTESRALLISLVQGIADLDSGYLFQQQCILFAPVPPLTIRPDLRIHARPDNIVRPPDEPYTEVPGDHFSLVFHAPIVAEIIDKLLTKNSLAA
jgi:pimeloyl-ACP methyl ester carboxylesterase